MPKYTEAEIDYVIDALDWGFMRNKIKSSPKNVDLMMNTLVGRSALIRFHLKRLWQEIKTAFRRQT